MMMRCCRWCRGLIALREDRFVPGVHDQCAALGLDAVDDRREPPVDSTREPWSPVSAFFYR